jgi:chemotaxis-related protein WspB
MLALTFQVGADRVAVDVRRVHEVVPRVRLTPATGAPGWVAGVFVYRGRIIPVIDLHGLLGLGPCPEHLSSRIILVPGPGDPTALVGLLATQVADIRELADPPPELAPSPTPTLGPAVADGTGILRLFDPDRFLPALAPELAGARP